MKKFLFSKTIALLLSFIFFASLFSICTTADGDQFPDVSQADAVFLYNVNTDKLIWSKNFEKQIFTGSITKMMCGLTFCEMFSDRIDESITLTSDMITGAAGAKIKLSIGNVLTYRDLLYGVICGGGNDACYALAVACSGSVEAYVKLMNDLAASWGLNSTHFTNPSGYDDEKMYTTAYDTLSLARRAINNELYMESSSALSYIIRLQNSDKEIKLFNRNSLISSFYASGYQNKYAYGLIAGLTDLGQYTAITYLEKGDTSFICAVMGARDMGSVDDILSYKYVNAISDYAFENYQYKKVFEADKYICSLEVALALPEGNEQHATVDCYSSDDVYAIISPFASVDTDVVYGYYLHDSKPNAPVRSGDVVGGVDIFCNGELIGSTKLVAGETVKGNSILSTLNSMKQFFLDRFFVASMIFFAVFITLYLVVDTQRLKKAIKKREPNSKRKKAP